MDGCFDMMHYGHCNALRQACALGDELIVGFISDDEIKANKGPPVTALRERMIMVPSVKWVSDIIYAITENIMNKLFNEYNIDYITMGPGSESRIVYIDGASDLFHAGDVEITAFNILLVVHVTIAENVDYVKKRNEKEASEKSTTTVKALSMGTQEASGASSMSDSQRQLIGLRLEAFPSFPQCLQPISPLYMRRL
ncbi:phosphoethanolamine cytidylyltransferase, putative, expressed [Panicum miliaceum]|uniref:ethanolamine-phosphate cytidylyltransferase n=1 Tax=Panicum miliaceum TaxID=4540 RepID=A0A3L6QNS1_PANMI|nr:phosphoethanolamine cytidylyltransferase, putative, expressed [Panicum miliaceum]